MVRHPKLSLAELVFDTDEEIVKNNLMQKTTKMYSPTNNLCIYDDILFGLPPEAKTELATQLGVVWHPHVAVVWHPHVAWIQRGGTRYISFLHTG